VSSPTPRPPEVSARGLISIASSRGIGSASDTFDISHITVEMTISGTGGGDAITDFDLEESLEDDVECDTIGDPKHHTHHHMTFARIYGWLWLNNHWANRGHTTFTRIPFDACTGIALPHFSPMPIFRTLAFGTGPVALFCTAAFVAAPAFRGTPSSAQ
jgi:hypothetical protein